MPADDVALSYWCGKNVLMEPKDRWRLFRTNSITERMLIISKSLDYVRQQTCVCGNAISLVQCVLIIFFVGAAPLNLVAVLCVQTVSLQTGSLQFAIRHVQRGLPVELLQSGRIHSRDQHRAPRHTQFGAPAGSAIARVQLVSGVRVANRTVRTVQHAFGLEVLSGAGRF